MTQIRTIFPHWGMDMKCINSKQMEGDEELTAPAVEQGCRKFQGQVSSARQQGEWCEAGPPFNSVTQRERTCLWDSLDMI